MRHRWVLLPVIVLVALLGFLIWQILREPEREAANTINIGVIMPLSGNVATLGQPCANGMQLAVEGFNQTRASKQPMVKLVAEDTLAHPKDAVAAFTKLVNTNHVVGVLGPLTSGEALAVAPLANENRTPLISPGASTPDLTQAGDYVFRNELSDKLGGLRQAQLALNKLGYRRIAALYMNNDYGVGLFNVFRTEFTSMGGVITIAEPYPPDTVDFRTVLARISSTRPDAIFAVGIDELVNIIEQARAMGITLPVYTTPIFENKTYISKLGSKADGVVYVYYGTFDPDAPGDVARVFVKNYTKRFGVPPTYYSALGYDAANLLLEALRRCNFKASDVKDALYAIHNFPGATGTSSFDRNGDIDKPVTLKTVRNGQFVRY